MTHLKTWWITADLLVLFTNLHFLLWVNWRDTSDSLCGHFLPRVLLWQWGQELRLNCRYPSTTVYGVASHKTAIVLCFTIAAWNCLLLFECQNNGSSVRVALWYQDRSWVRSSRWLRGRIKYRMNFRYFVSVGPSNRMFQFLYLAAREFPFKSGNRGL